MFSEKKYIEKKIVNVSEMHNWSCLIYHL